MMLFSALMGTNMQRQAVPCINPVPPMVGTGVEEHGSSLFRPCGNCRSKMVKLSEVDGSTIEIIEG